MTAHRAARLQLYSGILNTWCVAGWAWAAMGDLLGPWGWTAVLLLPFGVLEIAVGLYARAHPSPVSLVRWLALLEFLAVCIGGFPAACLGVFILMRVRSA